MILTCPSCSAKFMISSEALGSNGREVRCGKCAHMWFQEAERDSLDELAESAAAEEEKEFDIGLSDHEEPVASEEVSRPEAMPPTENEAVSFDEKTNLRRHVAAILAALAVTVVLLYGFIALRGPLSAAIPSLSSVYAALGFATLQSQESDLAFDRIKLTRNGASLSGSGYVINLTSHAVSLGPIKAELLNAQKEVLASTDIEMEKNEIAAESFEEIQFSFKDPPKQAEGVRIHIPR